MRAKPASPPNPLESYRAAVTADPQSASAHNNLGWGLYGQNQFADAIRELQEAVRLDGQLFDAHYGLGLAHKAAGAKADAIAAFKAAYDLAARMEDRVRGQMLQHLLHGHINQLTTGDWGLDKELRLHE
jgi:Tfp pilus assembly protein PilF